MATEQNLVSTDESVFPSPGDKILLQNLTLPHGIRTTNAWGDPKDQPACVTITLHLRDGFNTAAGQDKLDDSTIHYGELAKRVRGSCSGAALSLADTLAAVRDAVVGLSAKPSGFVVRLSEVQVRLGKASMFGSGGLVLVREWFGSEGRREKVQSVFSLCDVRTMTLVGVNAYERRGAQPVDFTLSLYTEGTLPVLDQSRLERMVIETIQGTEFETLETLVQFTMERIRTYFKTTDEVTSGSVVKLRLAKPQAVGFADAPAVEVCRRI
ncbi:Hypothetical protein R9X50_00371500 [Acrodontium crateriforme]|uniref:dihydroneopterin aldolase n=1 Tax=Acrodontium crateriforme TaxID=150365 RepID=A0AAQ3RC35_9PEZI|nr:Hypothetical protein R9X50_00371500 [Acrodontium crateriforme]